jgi:hypothetical protein
MENTCCICHDNENLEIIKTDCGHNFHNDCIANWIIKNDSCPCCRFKSPCGKKKYSYIWIFFKKTLLTNFVLTMHINDDTDLQQLDNMLNNFLCRNSEDYEQQLNDEYDRIEHINDFDF